ncbi:solute carrier family 22 member 7 [Rhipicephalus sanguineus]|uniref:Organic cation/carnitine transporter n=1 Tax=Rhipicephalus sanguineus TaxID=34632 RepID=A0A9D4SQC3_RHISA|nr:solute carrier family 22 member 7 [Rhipicephalus sanguineus]KAH7940343.1 hypothetical protein HPB52_023057 [Rhipicephalus sanguineus]
MDLLFLSRLARLDLRTSESFDCEECFGHGPFQKWMLFLILLGTFITHCQTLVVSLVTGDVDHWCKPPDGLNISAAEWKHTAIPMETDGSFSRCRVYERCKPLAEHDILVDRQDVGAVAPASGSWYSRCFPDQVQDINSTRDAPCEAWDYDIRTAESSAVSTWDMVCDRRLMRIFLVAMQSVGSIVALVAVGAFADYIGRRTLLLGSAIAMLTSTICTFLATGYAYYAMARFLAGGSSTVNVVFTYILPFESVTHAHRPQQLLLLAVIGVSLCEVWTVVINPVLIDWRLKQVIFLAPAALILPALWFARESPRWLVAKGRLDAAEAVMMRAATMNNFPLSATASLVQKLKEQAKNRAGCCDDNEDLLDARSLRSRALAMFAVCFSILFVFYVDTVSVVQYKEFWIPAFTVVITLLAYVLMHYLITGVTLVTVLSVCFVIVGCIQCALSIAATARFGKLTRTLLVLSKGVSNVLVIHCLTYIMELFPSALRAAVFCWSYACGRVAGMLAVLILVLQPAGYEDVVFAMTALFLFASLLIIRNLPKATVVEEAKIVSRDPTDSNKMCMDHMKRTLGNKMMRRRSPASGTESSRSTNRRRARSTGSNSSGSSKSCPGSNRKQALG